MSTKKIKNLDLITDSQDLKMIALAMHLEIDFKINKEGKIDFSESIDACTYNDNQFEAQGGDYLVCTDSEADELWDESLENYIEECILPELHKQYRSYFDNEAWKSDAKNDGRGHSLSSYDGNETEITVKGETFYIYQTN